MNFYIWSYSTDESDTEKYMEFSKKICIGCMTDYTYGGYVHFINNIDKTKEHHNHFILNQKSYFYITSLSKLMHDAFTSLSKLFVDDMI